MELHGVFFLSATVNIEGHYYAILLDLTGILPSVPGLSNANAVSGAAKSATVNACCFDTIFALQKSVGGFYIRARDGSGYAAWGRGMVCCRRGGSEEPRRHRSRPIANRRGPSRI